jgi:hypothetical protein
VDRAHGPAPAGVGVLGLRGARPSTVAADRPEEGPDAPRRGLPLKARQHLPDEHEPVEAREPATLHEGDLIPDTARHDRGQRREHEALVGVGQETDRGGDLAGREAHQPVLELDAGERPDRACELLDGFHGFTVPARRPPGKPVRAGRPARGLP